MSIRVFLADDHAVVREGLKLLVNAQPDMEVCGEAGDGEATCRSVELSRPDVLVLDVSMPVLNGIQVAQRLREQAPEARVLALTVHEDRGYLMQMLEAGAAGYVIKRAAAHELIHAIRIVAAGGTYMHPSMAAQVLDSLSRKRGRRTAENKELSDRERQVARMVAEGYSNKEIAAELGISVKTVETHKARLMEKLQIHSRQEVVRYAIAQGWLQTA